MYLYIFTNTRISTHALTWSATLDVVAVGRLLHMIRIRSFLVFKISARCS